MPNPKVMRFEAKIFEGHKEMIAFHIPTNPTQFWGRQDRYFVRGTMGRCKIEGEIGFRRGFHYMLLTDKILSAAGVAVGETSKFALTLRTPSSAELADKPTLAWARLTTSKAKTKGRAKTKVGTDT